MLQISCFVMAHSHGCFLYSVMHMSPLYQSHFGLRHKHAKTTNSASLSDQCLAGDYPVWECKSVLYAITRLGTPALECSEAASLMQWLCFVANANALLWHSFGL